MLRPLTSFVYCLQTRIPDLGTFFKMHCLIDMTTAWALHIGVLCDAGALYRSGSAIGWLHHLRLS